MKGTQSGENTLAIQLSRLVGLDASSTHRLVITCADGVVRVEGTTIREDGSGLEPFSYVMGREIVDEVHSWPYPLVYIP